MFDGVQAGVRVRWARTRARWPAVDHLARAGGRYTDERGDRLAAALSYYGFLAIFPVLLLALSVFGFLLAHDPGRQQQVVHNLNNFLPGVGTSLTGSLQAAAEHRAATGAIGLVGLALSGLGWIDAMRDALRQLWHQPKARYNVLSRRLVDLGVLGILGVAFALSAALAAVADAAPIGFLSAVLAVPLAVLADLLLCLVLFHRLAADTRPWRRTVKGALLGAVLLTGLKYVGSVYITRTVAHASELYGTVGLLIGLLIWINLTSRALLFAVAWTVTDEYDSDVPTFGSAPQPEQEPYPAEAEPRTLAESPRQ